MTEVAKWGGIIGNIPCYILTLRKTYQLKLWGVYKKYTQKLFSIFLVNGFYGSVT